MVLNTGLLFKENEVNMTARKSFQKNKSTL